MIQKMQPSETDDRNRRALGLVKRGVIAGYVLAAMNAFLAWRIYDIGYGINEAAGEDRIVIAVTTLLMAMTAAALTYRFSRKPSVAIAAVFLAWLSFEVAAKVLYGKPAPEYLAVAGLLCFGLVSGLRGAYVLRQAKLAGVTG
jgi:hypothetical protein